MNPEAPTVGKEVIITSFGEEKSGIILGRLKVNSSSLMQRDGGVDEVIAVTTDSKNKNPFKRVSSFTFQSLLKPIRLEDGEVVFTNESIQEANRVFDISKRLIPEFFYFYDVRVKSGLKFVLQSKGELVLMETNSVTYDKDGNPLLLLTNPKYRSNDNFVAAITPEEFEDSFPLSWCDKFRQAPTIEELLNFMLHKHPEGIEPDEIGIKGKTITVEMVIESWNRAVQDLPRESLKSHDVLGLRGAEHNFYDIKIINTQFGEKLVSLLRRYKPRRNFRR